MEAKKIPSTVCQGNGFIVDADTMNAKAPKRGHRILNKDGASGALEKDQAAAIEATRISNAYTALPVK